MKTRTLLAAMTLAVLSFAPAATPAVAQGLSYDICPVIGNFAEMFAGARFDGVKLSDLLQVVEETETSGSDIENSIKEISRLIVLDAYEMPAYRTESVKQDAILDFRNKWELECYMAD